MFKAESRFNLFKSDGRWGHVSKSIIWGGGILVWSSLMSNGKTDRIVFIRQSLNAERYQDSYVNDVNTIILILRNNKESLHELCINRKKTHTALLAYTIIYLNLRETSFQNIKVSSKSFNNNYSI